MRLKHLRYFKEVELIGLWEMRKKEKSQMIFRFLFWLLEEKGVGWRNRFWSPSEIFQGKYIGKNPEAH